MNADARAIFLEQRRKGLGGSDAAALLGFDRHKDITDLWREKVGLALSDDEPTNDRACERGNGREAAILDAYERRYGVRLKRGVRAQGGCDRAWMLASPDGLVEGANPSIVLYGVDAKSAIERVAEEEYGREDTDEIPVEHLLQGQWYCAVFGVDRWDFFVEVATRHRWEFRRYTVQRDAALVAKLIEAGERFWHENVIANVPPAPTSAPSMERLARARYPFASLPPIVTEDPVAIALVADYRAAKAAKKAAESSLEDIEARLKTLIGGAGGLETSVGCVTWLPTLRGDRRLKLKS